MFCQFRQISSSIGIHTTRVNIGDFDKFGNFGDVLPISSNQFTIGIHTTRVNIGDFGDFGDFDKFGNFGDVLPISSN